MRTFIRDIPPSIYNILDAPGQHNWEELGALAGFGMDEINRVRSVKYSGGSPTEQLLRVWGYKNVCVQELYETLAKMKHAHAMKLIKHLVDQKLHYMVENIEGPPLVNNSPDRRHQANYMAATSHQGPPPPPPSMSADTAMQMTPGYPQPNLNYQRLDHQYRVDDQRHSAEQANFYPTSPYSQYMPGNSVPSTSLAVQNLMSLGPNLPFNHPDSRMYGPRPSSPFMHQPQEFPTRSTDINREEREQLKNIAAFNTTIHMDYEVIKTATNNFDEKCKLGEGSFGKVYLADINQTKYAVKVLLQSDKLQIPFHNSQRSDQSKELKALAQYKHRNIVLMCFFSVDGENPCIIYEYIENGSLEDNLLGKKGRGPLSWKTRHQIAEGAALGINHLHKASKNSPLIHGDIKSANILLDKHFEPKIADFGLARPGPTNGKSRTILMTKIAHGTLPYLPEEFKRNLQLSVKVDSFSFGVVLMEMLTGERAYDDKRDPHPLLCNYVTHMIENSGMPIQQLKDKKCPDWPDKPFEEILMLANRLVKRYAQRPDMDKVVLCLKVISSGKDVKDQSHGAGAAETRDALSSLQYTELWKKQETAACLPPTKQKWDISCKEDADSELAEEERQRSIEEFHRKVDLMSRAKIDGPGNPSRHSPAVGTDSSYSKEYLAGGATEPSFPVGNHQVQPPSQVLGNREYRNPWEESFHSQINPQSGFKQNEAGPMPRTSDTTLSSRYQDTPNTSESSNYPYSYTHRYLGGKETAADRAFYEGYQLGFQRGFQEAVLQQMRGMQQGREHAERLFTPHQMFPERETGHPPSTQMPLSSLHQSMGNSPNMRHAAAPDERLVSPEVNLRFAANTESRLLASMDPNSKRNNCQLTNNKTDDAKVTTSGELSETNSHEKSVAALQTKPISLHEFRNQKEPQQSTEPIEGQ